MEERREIIVLDEKALSASGICGGEEAQGKRFGI